jgi:hypothetical protein
MRKMLETARGLMVAPRWPHRVRLAIKHRLSRFARSTPSGPTSPRRCWLSGTRLSRFAPFAALTARTTILLERFAK